MSASPIFTTLDFPPVPCQRDIRAVSIKTNKESFTPPLESKLSQLDLVDLELLWWIVELERATAKTLSRKIYLSYKATLHRARKKVDLGLARMHSEKIAKGAAHPTTFFFPPPGLTKSAIEKAIADSSSQVQDEKMSEEKSSNVDDIGILMLKLLKDDVADSVPGMMAMLGCTESTSRSRFKTFEKNGWVKSRKKPSTPGHRGSRLVVYSLSASLPSETIENVLKTVDLDRIDVKFSLDPSVDWEGMGIRYYQDYLNTGEANTNSVQKPIGTQMTTTAISNGHHPDPVFQPDPVVQDVAASGEHKTVSSEHIEVSPQLVPGAEEQEVWVVLRTMAEKLAEYEERLARLESRPQDSHVQQMSAEILAIIPPVVRREAS